MPTGYAFSNCVQDAFDVSRTTDTLRHETPFGVLVEQGPRELLSDHATRFMLQHLVVSTGSRVAEPGCGTGVLSLAAALAGAETVTGTDIDPAAIAAAHRNARLNNLPQVVFRQGNLLEPVDGGLDLIIALLPHKPAPRRFNHRYFGGTDGTDLLLAVIQQAHERLVTGGRLLLYVNSIANPPRIAQAFEAGFDVRLLAEKKRYFTQAEFDGLTPGMFAHLEHQAASGAAAFATDAEGLFFMARIFEGRRR